MQLTIISINKNNHLGLDKTVKSVLSQKRTDFEYIIIDGASNDGSLEIIEQFSIQFGGRLKWVSEPDNGIYHAMNKGIKMASGDYLQFLNSGDCLASDDVVEKMYSALESNASPSILYGNMLKIMPNGAVFRDKCFAGQDISLLGFYIGTLNHSPAYISKALFDKYGFYDESLKIVSDWKWYLQVIIFGGEKPVYSDIDVSLFDMTGISETNKTLDKDERKLVLSNAIPSAILSDYIQWSFPIEQIKRLQRHPLAYRIVWFIERCLFLIERRQQKRKGEVQYR